MTMTKASLVSRLKAAFGVPETDEGVAIQEDTFDKIAGAVLDEIQQNGVISTTVSGTAAVASGSSAGTWPVTGTGTGTIA